MRTTTPRRSAPRHSVPRRLVAVAGCLSLGALLSGCGSALGDDRNTVDYWLWDANQQPAYQECADRFEEDNPDLEIRIEQRGYDDYWNGLALGFVAESAPDVFTNHLSKYPEYVTRDLLLPLDEYVERDDVPLDIYEEGLADLWVGEDGRRYGLPKDWDAVGVFYDRAMLAEAGVDESTLDELTWNPDDGGSYEELIARLTVDVNGVRGDEPGFDPDRVETYGLWLEMTDGFNHGQTQYSMYAYANGWEATDRNPWGREFHFDDPAFQETITWWRGLIEKGYMPSFAAQRGVQSSDQLAAGNAAMVTNGSWMTGTFFSYEGLDVGVAPNPIGPTGQRATMFNGLADSVYRDTDNPEAAWQWVRYLASPECQRIVGAHHVVFPAITEAWEIAREEFAADGIDVTPFTRHVEEGTTELFPITDHSSEIAALMQPALEAVMSGRAPVESLNEVNEEINRLFE
ncbi:carbohydrate ABC transporter substrate-binding protein, CUT1 family [Streptomyces zhaozhouensis]|uniref:Carbohydrate ABC transporter substrate-binding protein, CUT1 family n=1 Tax=Streptomyces zhaozhouensis TaxID=1300267 RepID=A0A286DPB3_9ACTN|nr:sugar ABC transporter substrate-binding protein [Streptomyces zhaozhouensis]SOD60479.1 carbohydrate ABC transporter substrate-binding protein, CUT1 family [Streptomyces zhaozhouensis]